MDSSRGDVEIAGAVGHEPVAHIAEGSWGDQSEPFHFYEELEPWSEVGDVGEVDLEVALLVEFFGGYRVVFLIVERSGIPHSLTHCRERDERWRPEGEACFLVVLDLCLDACILNF